MFNPHALLLASLKTGYSNACILVHLYYRHQYYHHYRRHCHHHLHRLRHRHHHNLHPIGNFSPDSLGLSTVTSNTRGCGMRLKQSRAINKSCAALFSHRGPSKRNKLPLAVTKHLTLTSFTTALKQYLN